MEYLQIGEWARWREDDREFKVSVLKSLDELKSDSVEQAVEIRFLKAKQTKSSVAAGMRTLISGVVGGIVGSFK